jgi:hypothetical protein
MFETTKLSRLKTKKAMVQEGLKLLISIKRQRQIWEIERSAQMG